MKIELESLTAGANYWSVIFDSRPIGRFYVREISITEKCETMQSGGTLVQYGHRKDLVIHGTCHPGRLNGGLDGSGANLKGSAAGGNGLDDRTHLPHRNSSGVGISTKR